MAPSWIGTGGWAYFTGAVGNRLRDYAKAFSFVEVNSTFYEMPSLATARRWRRTVPRGFEFSMKAPSVLTHRLRLRSGPTLRRAAVAATHFASALRAMYCILETPSSLAFGPLESAGVQEIAGALSETSPETRLGLEARSYRGRELPPKLRATMERAGVADVVDLSIETPRVATDVVYTRLFGPGQGNRWEFTDDELRNIANRADDARAERTVFAFHGVRMYKDAARFLGFRRSGEFPPVTKGDGLASLEEVLRDGGTSFPATRGDLLAGHGWRVVRVDGRTVHAAALLQRLAPEPRFPSISDVLEGLVSSR